ncbi:MAG TPA: hypothetical protein VFR81_23590 [Longimicrobium sp.]|nr:hypothetical protein [Longimicrobium sp.]
MTRPSTQPGLEVRECPVCGTYAIPPGLAAGIATGKHADRLGELSAVLRWRAESGEVPLVSMQGIRELLASIPSPRTVPEALESLLFYLGDRQKRFSDYVQVDPRKFPVTVASSFEDFRYVADLLLGSGYAEVYDDALRDQFRLTPAGWTRLNELRATRPDSSRAFVAMWFADELTPAWTEGIRPGLEDAGYTAVRLDAVEHNEKIDDRIIAEIRRSGLVVADLTGGRANVYFEAGFAMGLGVPVIWTCREDHLDDLHFDTRQYNYIGWTTPAELRERLRLRIEATLPRKADARR